MSICTAHLTDRAVIRLEGDGVLAFLQDLVTADVEALAPGEAAYGALLTPQGKILFDFFVLATEAGALIDCDRGQSEALLMRLAMYKLRRSIVIGIEAGLGVAAAWGDSEMPPLDGASVWRDPRLSDLGLRIIAPEQAVYALATAASADYAAARIGLGIASTADIGSGETFPHEANFDQFGGVSFAKGCYVGQEVVSRMEHRGTARSRIVPVEAASALPEPGTPILAGERQIGSLRGCAGTRGLALLRLDRAAAAEAAGLPLSAAGTPLTWRKPAWARWQIAEPGED